MNNIQKVIDSTNGKFTTAKCEHIFTEDKPESDIINNGSSVSIVVDKFIDDDSGEDTWEVLKFKNEDLA
jgi:hypothetical protein